MSIDEGYDIACEKSKCIMKRKCTMRRKCIIWGMGRGYEEILNQIRFEIYKENMEVIAVVCRSEDKYCTHRDGFSIISKEEIGGLDFEYVIISSYLFSKRYDKKL